jgi:hypothetical protein
MDLVLSSEGSPGHVHGQEALHKGVQADDIASNLVLCEVKGCPGCMASRHNTTKMVKSQFTNTPNHFLPVNNVVQNCLECAVPCCQSGQTILNRYHTHAAIPVNTFLV